MATRPLRLLLALVAMLAAGAAAASSGDRVTNYRGGGAGPVTFDPRTHARAGLLCRDCHADRFPTQRTGLISRLDHERGTACFGCHDGQGEPKTCRGCHRR